MRTPTTPTAAPQTDLTQAHRAAPQAQGKTPLGFGLRFTDHMITIRWTEAHGWDSPRLQPYQPLTLDPAAVGLHYGQIVFEGLKAYRQPDDSIALFRPHYNAERLNKSATRLAIPTLPEETFLEALNTLVHADAAQVPSRQGQSLYLRPYIMATEPMIGVRPAHEYLFVLIASPVDPYFSSGVKPVSVWVTDTYTRTAPGQTGDAKYPGNYASGFLAQQEATEHGCDQVVWLDATHRTHIEEMGAMNLFFVHQTHPNQPPHLTTPPLTGTLLPGAVRDTLLTLAADNGYTVNEQPTTIEEWQSGWQNGGIQEVFATGTAAIVTPVKALHRDTHQWHTPNRHHTTALHLRQQLLDIQHGAAPDPHHWLTPTK